jgi:hypothetical protein
MQRREFLKSVAALTAGGALPAAPAVWSPAKAQSRQETLLIVSESGPNNIDIHGVGTNVPATSLGIATGSATKRRPLQTGSNTTSRQVQDELLMILMWRHVRYLC